MTLGIRCFSLCLFLTKDDWGPSVLTALKSDIDSTQEKIPSILQPTLSSILEPT